MPEAIVGHASVHKKSRAQTLFLSFVYTSCDNDKILQEKRDLKQKWHHKMLFLSTNNQNNG